MNPLPIVSYSQNFEDIMLWRALQHVEHGFYTDAGAAWPNEDSVTKLFYDRGWRGINIEPNRLLYEKLRNSRIEDTNLDVAVGEQPGLHQMMMIGDTGLSTLIDTIAENHISAGRDTETREVSITTLRDIWDRHVLDDQPIHFLKVDVEGYEGAALRGNDWKKYRPWIVVVEATIPSSQVESYEEWEPVLLAAEYIFVYTDGLNRFYVATEHDELVASFQYPPNIFDGFVLSSQVIAETRAQEAEAKAQEAEAKAQEAEAKAQEAEVKAQEAEVKAQEAETKAQEAETKAQEAEAKAHSLEQLLATTLSSRSWRITVPFRIVSGKIRRLHDPSRPVAFFLFRFFRLWFRFVRMLLRRPWRLPGAIFLGLRRIFARTITGTLSRMARITVVKRIGLFALKPFPRFEQRVRTQISSPNTEKADEEEPKTKNVTNMQFAGDEFLNARARRIYSDLINAMGKKAKGECR